MPQDQPHPESTCLVLENRHTGEHLELRRIRRGDEIWLELRGTLPPHREGPPLHIHFAEDEEGTVHSGTLSAVVDGRKIQVNTGESASFPRGSVHRWWNDHDEPLEFVGFARPVVDLDRYLQSLFEVLNAGPANRPPLTYLAHVLLRHRRTQGVALMPQVVQAVLFRMAYLAGLLLGRYRGNDWPGSPDRCTGAPLVSDEE